MDSPYIEALNVGFLRGRASKGEVRDPFLLDEIDQLNESIPPPPSPASAPLCPGDRVTTTIPPPSWKRI
jgi:hypothetical protein